MRSEIKLILVLGLVAGGTAVLGYFKAVPGIGNQAGDFPSVEITPRLFDFGQIKLGDVVNYSFRVQNLGQGVLEIKRVATSCACASAQIAKEKIDPGEAVELLVSYDSGAMPLHGSGREERIIYLRSNDPINPQVEVRIYATVIK